MKKQVSEIIKEKEKRIVRTPARSAGMMVCVSVVREIGGTGKGRVLHVMGELLTQCGAEGYGSRRFFVSCFVVSAASEFSFFYPVSFVATRVGDTK